MDWPTISIITVGLNAERILGECYESIRLQDYPKERIEMLFIDGGSTDRTKEIAVKFKAKIVDGGYKNNQEARRYIGFQHAKNDILVYIDSDNVLPENSWLKKMVRPFIESKRIIATQTLRYHYDRSHSAMNRYFALFGMNDPVAFYLGKADRLPWFEDKWNLLGKIVEDKDDYYKIRFSSQALPTIGCNGFLVRKSVFEKLSCAPDEFFHIDVNVDLIERGLDCYGIVKNSISHITSDTFFNSIKKRIQYMKIHSCKLEANRRYKVFDVKNKTDVFNLMRFMFCTIFLIHPFYESLRGYVKIKDKAWFLHPLFCLGILFGYGYTFFLRFFCDLFRRVETNET